ncbi:MAG: hypothetical protein RL518_2245 [Pseudomonadota bacterium]|jgi:hypothetical protein
MVAYCARNNRMEFASADAAAGPRLRSAAHAERYLLEFCYGN